MLRKHGELATVTDEVNLRYEVCEFLDQVKRAGKPALLFEKIKGHSTKVVGSWSAQKNASRWPLV